MLSEMNRQTSGCMRRDSPKETDIRCHDGVENRRVGLAGGRVFQSALQDRESGISRVGTLTGCSSCIWSPSRMRFFAHRAIATALVKGTWPASSMKRKSSTFFHSGRAKSHAVPAATPVV